MSLTQDQKNVLRAYNLSQPDPYAAELATSVLSDANASALVNNFLPTAAKTYPAQANRLNSQINALQGQLSSVNALLTSVNNVIAVNAALAAQSPST